MTVGQTDKQDMPFFVTVIDIALCYHNLMQLVLHVFLNYEKCLCEEVIANKALCKQADIFKGYVWIGSYKYGYV